MSQDTLIKVEHLTRHYGHLIAVDSINFEVARGEVVGFLGPNGAGKSTAMQMITGNLAPTTGRIQICDHDLLDSPKAAKSEIGYLPEYPPLYLEFTVDEYLKYCARLNRIAKNKIKSALDQVKQRCGLEQVGHRLISNLSKGYQQRVGIAQAIIHLPAVVVLDEPTVGLDPIQIREIRSLIRELGKEHGVILSTHILPEVQMTCDRVQIINKGKLVFADNISSLNQRMQSSALIVRFKQAPEEQQLAKLSGVMAVERLDANAMRVQHKAGDSPAERIVDQAVHNGWKLYELSPEHKSLEQIFIDITTAEHSVTEHAP